MTYIPPSSLQRHPLPAVKSLIPVRQTLTRDILWNQPVFRAPALPNPRVTPEPLPFLAARPAFAVRRS
jgi:hypothetical protein